MDSFFLAEDKRTPEEIEELKKNVQSELREVIDPKWVTTDPLMLDTYSWQYVAEFATGTHYVGRPLAVVLPGNNEDIIEVIKVCKKYGCQYKPFSTGFGAWSAPIRDDFVVQIDLRRLDRIIKLDKENMYAVIEPYVTGNQLQTEAMKVGLNTHIAGVGSQASILASATSMMGQGWDGISLGFSDRNLLGVEWITPEGKVAQLGSFEPTGEYFLGDGPGLSLRGVMRGFGGAMGGLGIFTKCAVKMYPWHGPAKLKMEGTSPNYFTEIPENHAAGIIVVNSWDDMAELGYRLGEAEIVDLLGRNAPALNSGVLTVDNSEFVDIYKIPLLREMHYALMFVLLGQDKKDYQYKMKTLKKIVKDLNGGIMYNGEGPDKMYWMLRMMAAVARKAGWWQVIKSIPGFSKLTMRDVKRFGRKGADYMSAIGYEAMVRSGMNMRGAFKYGGSFHTSMGALVAWDVSVRGAKVGEQIKRKFIKEGLIFDDGGDNAWGGLYEGGAFSHLEELCMYDPRDPKCRQAILDFVVETNLACIEEHCGDSINAIGPPNHALYSPACMNYDKWQQKIKAALDPKNVSDANFYTDPNYEKNPPPKAAEAIVRVLSNRTKIEID